MKRTVRDVLTEHYSFDWEKGQVLWQRPKEAKRSPGWGDVDAAMLVGPAHPAMLAEWESGNNAPSCPRFIACDRVGLYFPVFFAGYTRIVRVLTDIEQYLDFGNHRCPYFGAQEARR